MTLNFYSRAGGDGKHTHPNGARVIAAELRHTSMHPSRSDSTVLTYHSLLLAVFGIDAYRLLSHDFSIGAGPGRHTTRLLAAAPPTCKTPTIHSRDEQRNTALVLCGNASLDHNKY